MRAIDANVLVRLITRDDAGQVAAAENDVAPGAWVSHLVLAETVWVLESVYSRGPREIAATVELLLDSGKIALQDPAIVAAALATFRESPTVGFAVCLILETGRKHGHLPLGTFDRGLAKQDGVERFTERG
jgi:predicted nucleic-acid-binding protein